MDDHKVAVANDELAIWHRDGAVVLDRFFDADTIAAVRADCDALFAGRGQRGDG
ncbi:hypothetical protein [Sphingomonas sp. CCH10-B3]|uniref:hypothetical protein n=1 Tax=Sphingomonas sp. CCH10-B3 TaxID=1768757 RepID=UPI000AB0B2F3|nr:hypothetical protein [Sphingomonas sp. CCH10-B3]